MKFIHLSTSTLCCLVALKSFAQIGPNPQSVIEKSQSISNALSLMANRLQPNEIFQIDRQLDGINSILAGRDNNHGGDHGGRPATSVLTCVARDNDGRAPYQIAVKTDPVTSRKIPNAITGSLQECQISIQGARPVDSSSYLLCVTKDGDGRGPYSFVRIDYTNLSGSDPKQMAIGDTFDGCQSELAAARLSLEPRGISFCVAKDNDGRSPYVKAFLEGQSGSLKRGTDTYDSIGQCRAAF